MFNSQKNKYTVLTVLAIVFIWLFVTPTAHNAPDFESYAAGSERKAAFFEHFSPLIDKRNAEIVMMRKDVIQWQDNKADLGWWDEWQLQDLATQYRVKNFDIANDDTWQLLLNRIDVIPPSLVLAQAANESAWGTSRFAKSANNYFGQWCYEKGCGLVPKKRDLGKVHEVAAFDSSQASLESYMRNLNSHPAYKQLRNIRSDLKANEKAITGNALAAGLTNYSERRGEYIKELRSMMRYNELAKFDASLDDIE